MDGTNPPIDTQNLGNNNPIYFFCKNNAHCRNQLAVSSFGMQSSHEAHAKLLLHGNDLVRSCYPSIANALSVCFDFCVCCVCEVRETAVGLWWALFADDTVVWCMYVAFTVEHHSCLGCVQCKFWRFRLSSVGLGLAGSRRIAILGFAVSRFPDCVSLTCVM